jgi:hypothetical protein
MCETNDDDELVLMNLDTMNEILDLIEFAAVQLRESTRGNRRHLKYQLERVLALLDEEDEDEGENIGILEEL